MLRSSQPLGQLCCPLPPTPLPGCSRNRGSPCSRGRAGPPLGKSDGCPRVLAQTQASLLPSKQRLIAKTLPRLPKCLLAPV